MWNIIQWWHETIEGRWLAQKNQWKWIMMVVRKPLHPCGPVSRTTTSSFAIYTVCTSWCGNNQSLLVCVHDVVVVLGCEEELVGVHIIHPRTKNYE
jgi:hypothetical protein